jgi:hypothetical protein
VDLTDKEESTDVAPAWFGTLLLREVEATRQDLSCRALVYLKAVLVNMLVEGGVNLNSACSDGQ